MKDLRTEQFRLIYDKLIYPKNTRMSGKMPDAAVLYEKEGEILRQNIRKLQKERVYVPPSR